MRTLYESKRATVLLGDARDALRDLPRESVDLVIVDPPYGVEWRSRRRAEQFERIAGDGAHERDDVRAILQECVRVVGQHRHLYVFGPVDVLDGLKVAEPAALVWDKCTPGLGSVVAPWGPAHEPIAFAVSKYRHGGKRGAANLPARMRKGSVLRFPRPTGRKVRVPTEKPWPLLAELVESSSRLGDVVLDPCAGSGSTGVAAILRGRSALLVEIDEQTAQLAVERVRQAEQLVDAMRQL